MPENYTVAKGDTLSSIASRYGVKVSDITGYRSGNPNLIYPGEKLSIGKSTPAPVTTPTPTPVPPANTIQATNLGQDPYKVQQLQPNSAYSKLIDSTNVAITSGTKTVTEDAARMKTVYDTLGSQSMKKTDLYESEGVYDKKAEYDRLVNIMNQKDLASRRRVERIRNENPTGQLSEGQRIAIEKEEREWASEKADLAIAAAFAQDDYTLAKTIIDDKIKAETDSLTTELAGLQYFYEQNYNRLSDDRKTLLQMQMQEITDEKEEKERVLTAIGRIQEKVAENGGTAEDIIRVGQSKDLESALVAAGKYISDDAGGSGFDWTNTQTAQGAQNAGVSIAEFNTFDDTTKNFFINGVDDAKANIDDSLETSSVDDVKKAIEDSNLPLQAKEYLLEYTDSKAGSMPTDEEVYSSIQSTIGSLKEQGYTRGEAYDATYTALTTDEKGNKVDIVGSQLDKIKTNIKDALADVYGRTLLQRILPGGR